MTLEVGRHMLFEFPPPLDRAENRAA